MQLDIALRGVIQATRRLLGSERVVVLWEEPEEPWLKVTTLSELEVRTSEYPPEPELIALWRSLRRPALLRTGDSTRPAGVVRRLAEEAGIGEAVLIPLRSSVLRGCIVASRPASKCGRWRAETVRARGQQLLERLTSAEWAAVDALRAERAQVAHDLHDGPLQALTAATLQLRAIERSGELSQPLAERLVAVREQLTSEHRELRIVVDALLDDWTARAERGGLLLEEAVRRVARAWDIKVDLENRLPADLSHELVHQIGRIVQEGIVNAARHGHAKWARVRAWSDPTQVAVVIDDDGSGFPFAGTYTLAELDRMQRGPIVLKRRVAGLRGDLVLHSAPGGSRVEITLPLPQETVNAD